ncbi:MAG: amino acid ABC transporter substrate-binding protein [Dehalococcoidia bacterium]|jgi:ABC-type amino acid transport substrate-binding protein|nr:MAG: amino acid ABC transporter substrate-binding protein [Dehalococcoidia bacterium]
MERLLRAVGAVAFTSLVAALLVGASIRPPAPPPNPRAAQARLQGVLKIGMDPSYPPIASLDGRGNLSGLDVDVAVELARRFNVRPDFIGMDIGALFDGLGQRRFDVIISGIPPLPEYGRDVIYSAPYFNGGQVILVRAGTEPPAGPASLRGTVAVEIGSGGEIEGRRIAAGGQVRLLVRDSPAAVVAAVRDGQAEAGILDRLSAVEAASPASGVVIAGPPFTLEPYVVAARRGDDALLAEIDAMLAAMRADGTLERIEAKWLRPSGLDPVNGPSPPSRP